MEHYGEPAAGSPRFMRDVVPMKKMMIKAIGVVLVVLGAFKMYACLRTLIAYAPLAVGTWSEIAWSLYGLNLLMVAIGLGKIVGGLGLLWLKSWAKWIAIVSVLLHVTLLVYFGLPIWMQMLQGTFKNPAGIPMWHDSVTIGSNLMIAAALMFLLRQEKEGQPAQPHLGRYRR